MKKIMNYFVSLFLVIAMPLSYTLGQDSFSSSGNSVNGDRELTVGVTGNALPHLNLTVSIPASLQTKIVREDYENESIFSLKTTNESPVFLFSITKISTGQWMKVKSQIKAYTIVANEDGFITFVQKTDVKKIKGSEDAQYQMALREIDAIVSSIEVK